MRATISTSVPDATEFLNRGKLVAIPTETVYGLAANALNADAVVSIFETKNRPHFDPLIVHVAGIEQVHEVAVAVWRRKQVLLLAGWRCAVRGNDGKELWAFFASEQHSKLKIL